MMNSLASALLPAPSSIDLQPSATVLIMAYTGSHDAQASTNYKEAFALFDKRGNGRVPQTDLGDLLRACGQNPTLAEISDLQKSVGSDCTYPQFYSALCCSASTPDRLPRTPQQRQSTQS